MFISCSLDLEHTAYNQIANETHLPNSTLVMLISLKNDVILVSLANHEKPPLGNGF